MCVCVCVDTHTHSLNSHTIRLILVFAGLPVEAFLPQAGAFGPLPALFLSLPCQHARLSAVRHPTAIKPHVATGPSTISALLQASAMFQQSQKGAYFRGTFVVFAV